MKGNVVPTRSPCCAWPHRRLAYRLAWAAGLARVVCLSENGNGDSDGGDDGDGDGDGDDNDGGDGDGTYVTMVAMMAVRTYVRTHVRTYVRNDGDAFA